MQATRRLIKLQRAGSRLPVVQWHQRTLGISARFLTTQKNTDKPKGKAKGKDDLANTWQWVAPTRQETEDTIPVKLRELLTVDEVEHALNTEGGADVDVVKLKEPMDTITHLVFVTGHTGRHLRRMADTIVRALKHRELQEIQGTKGAEGYDDDDWMCIDCGNIVVHLMQQHTRQVLSLEQHWRAEKRLEAPVTNDPDKFERLMDELVAANPTPAEYQAAQDEDDQQLRKLKPVKTL